MTHYDVLVIGSGFGGSVSALRLSEKGYSVGVLEAGARFADEDFPRDSFDFTKYVFAPALGMYGIQRIALLKDCLILAGAGVGGGSLVYANTLYEPLDAFYSDPAWAHVTDWKAELAPYYDQAKRMLGVITNPWHTPTDDVIEAVAARMGVSESYHPAPVGVLFGRPDQPRGTRVDDPYFGGAGPARSTCTACGECITGCRHNAKNTLVKNYLHLAEGLGAKVHPLTTVTRVRPRSESDGGGYEVTARWTKAKMSRGSATTTFTADQVVFSAASLGTQKLLHRLKADGDLPGISERLGMLTRTNSEAITGAVGPADAGNDFTYGVSITSSFHPDDVTHIEPVRFGKGSNSMSLLQSVLAEKVPGERRLTTWAKSMWAQRRRILDFYDLKHWSERSIILLVMQTVDNSITTVWKRTPFGMRMSSVQGEGQPNPTYIPQAYEAARLLADELSVESHDSGDVAGRAMPGGTIGEPFERPMTAHFIGGCTIGTSPETGVIDPYQRLYGHPGLHVVDGSAISANLGVNPSLTITAQAERAMAFWPNKGERDPRPDLGAAYERIGPVTPKTLAVPDSAPGAYRLPVVQVT